MLALLARTKTKNKKEKKEEEEKGSIDLVGGTSRTDERSKGKRRDSLLRTMKNRSIGGVQRFWCSALFEMFRSYLTVRRFNFDA